ncbi:MAG: NUDIX domain-containing protein [Candidatus Pacebacteria bacterium]|nr:NUDIX domain-containing protein [Candidatus Paceibacterota bacterium]
MKEDRSKIKACVGVMVFKDGKILMGKRKGSHGEGEYSFTGGHLEFGESFFECAKRETKEEAGIEIKNIKFLSVVNIVKHENRQDVLLNFIADWSSGEITNDENEKIGEWGWYPLDDLPTPIFYPSQVLINSYKEGVNFYDKE